MKRKRSAVFIPKLARASWLPSLAALSAAFLSGILLGCFWTNAISGSEGSALVSYIHSYLDAVRTGGLVSPGIFTLLWESFRWPALIFLLSFTAVGLIAIPAVFMARGFLLSFAVAALIKSLGMTGAALAVLLFGLTGLLSFPVLFVLGSQGLRACYALAVRLMGNGRKRAIYGKDFFGRAGVCCVILLCCVCLERTVIPSLIMVLAGTF